MSVVHSYDRPGLHPTPPRAKRDKSDITLFLRFSGLIAMQKTINRYGKKKLRCSQSC